MLRTRCSILLLALVGLAYVAPTVSSPRFPGHRELASLGAPPPECETPPELRRRSFDIVWQTVKDKHFDPQFGGVDWDGVKDKYLPRLAGIKTDEAFYGLLQQMLGELHQSHFAIYPPGTLAEDDSREPTSGSIGADVRIVGGLAVITRIQPGSPAARAGLGTGFVVEAIDGAPTKEIIDRVSSGPEPAGIRVIHQVRAVLARLNGEPGTFVEVSYTGKPGTRSSARVQRERLTGEMSARMGNFPPQYVEFDSRRLQGGIGYIRFNIFVISIMERLRATIRSAHDAAGIIIDLRGNPGGLGQMSCGLAAMLESDQTSLGTMKLRAGFQNFAVFPQSGAYLGPVVVLIDEMSASTSEIFAGGMQALGRALVVGKRSAGAALPSIFEKLPTGAVFQYAIGDFTTPRGALIEGHGVTPDVEVALGRDALLQGRDPQVDAALKAIDHMRQTRPEAPRVGNGKAARQLLLN